METAPRRRSNFVVQPVLDADLEPLYALPTAVSEAVINRLSNLVVAMMAHAQQANDPDLARRIADRAHEILLDDDEDRAEYVRWVVGRPET